MMGLAGQGLNLILLFNGEKIYLCIWQLCDTCPCHKLLKQHIFSKPLNGHRIVREKAEQ